MEIRAINRAVSFQQADYLRCGGDIVFIGYPKWRG
jgi:hypothetical protein